MIPERLAALRQEMEKRDIAVYIVPTADFHELPDLPVRPEQQ